MRSYQKATVFTREIEVIGGGVLLAINSRIPCKQVDVPIDIEAVTIQLSFSIPIFVCVLYIPPQSNYEYYKKCFKYIFNLSNQHKPLIIAGDFNLPDINWSTLTGGSAVANELCNIIFEINLFQHIDQPTHIQGNMLDLILSSGEDLVHSLKVLSNHQTSIQSDHYIITFNLLIGLVDRPKKEVLTMCTILGWVITLVCALIYIISY